MLSILCTFIHPTRKKETKLGLTKLDNSDNKLCQEPGSKSKKNEFVRNIEFINFDKLDTFST